MSDETDLRQQREALNTAINNHDLETTTSFLHPDFVAQGTDGHSYNRQAAIHQLEQYLQPSVNFHSQVEVEHVEVSGDSATLRVCRTESGRMHRPEVFWGFLAAAAAMAYIAISSVVDDAAQLSNFTPTRYWGVVGGLVGLTIGFVCFIVGAFAAGRRSIQQTQRAEETWRRVDGRWLMTGERQLSGIVMKSRKRLAEVAVGAVVVLAAATAVGAYDAWKDFTDPGREFQRSGDPALKLAVRRASTNEVDGWNPMTVDNRQEKTTFHVSPEVELTNEDVLSTCTHFQPGNTEAVSRWKGGATFLVFSAVLFGVYWRSKDYRWWCGVSGVVCLLLGLGLLWHGLTSTAARFEQQGSWQVVIRFNDAGTRKLADLTAQLAPTQTYPPIRRPYPSNHVAFLIDGELTFVVPVWEQNAEGDYLLVQSTHLTKGDDPEGLSEEYVTRIAKGIVGP